MSFMDKFKKKDDDLGLDNPEGAPPGGDPFSNQPSQDPFNNQPTNQFSNPTNNQPTNQNPMGPPPQEYGNPDLNNVKNIAKPREPTEQTSFNNPTTLQPTNNNTHVEKDLQLIIAKLDGLKSELDSLHQRVQKIEKIAEADQATAQQQRQQRYRW